ncbi:MAG: DUF3568 family protein [Candidatus Omnitrophica bacterium]|nr:DUF3568 family protein [Candidatus Omnitrophota bacterium]
MKKVLSLIVLCSALLTGISGCAPLIVGGAVGAIGGYAASRDTVQGETDKNYDSLWNAAVEVARIRGKVKKEDFTKGIIEMQADSSRVTITLVKVTLATTRLKVASRKFHFPNLALSQELFVKIMDFAK